jgi:hypothetical protein
VSTADDPVIVTAMDRMRRNFIVGRWWCGVGRRWWSDRSMSHNEEIRIMSFRSRGRVFRDLRRGKGCLSRLEGDYRF